MKITPMVLNRTDVILDPVSIKGKFVFEEECSTKSHSPRKKENSSPD
jgi:hypothetical protein